MKTFRIKGDIKDTSLEQFFYVLMSDAFPMCEYFCLHTVLPAGFFQFDRVISEALKLKLNSRQGLKWVKSQ